MQKKRGYYTIFKREKNTPISHLAENQQLSREGGAFRKNNYFFLLGRVFFITFARYVKNTQYTEVCKIRKTQKRSANHLVHNTINEYQGAKGISISEATTTIREPKCLKKTELQKPYGLQ